MDALQLAWLASFVMVCIANAALPREAALIPAAALAFSVPLLVLLLLRHPLQAGDICGVAVGALLSAVVVFAARVVVGKRGKREP